MGQKEYLIEYWHKISQMWHWKSLGRILVNTRPKQNKTPNQRNHTWKHHEQTIETKDKKKILKSTKGNIFFNCIQGTIIWIKAHFTSELKR